MNSDITNMPAAYRAVLCYPDAKIRISQQGGAPFKTRNARAVQGALGLAAGLILAACQPAQPVATEVPPAATEKR